MTLCKLHEGSVIGQSDCT